MKKKSLITLYSLLFSGLFLFTISCKKETKIPELFTTEISAITQTTALCGGYIQADAAKNAEITERGVCWSLSANPTSADNKTSEGTGSGSYTSTITGLTAGTVYYMRAFATNSAGTGYGNIISFTTTQAVLDYEGNVYHTVRLGTQTWMVENLQVSHFKDGSIIPFVMNASTWNGLSTAAYCHYNDDLTVAEIYGKLYNWYAVHDSRGIAPAGWHVASWAEWTALYDYLGGADLAGGKLKESGFVHWQSPNTGATNETGFTALPAGERNDAGTYMQIGQVAYWWTSTEILSGWSGFMDMTSGSTVAQSNYTGQKAGFPVRCIKD